MKEFVVGAPYTTETTLDSDDEFLIVACDGVRVWVLHLCIILPASTRKHTDALIELLRDTVVGCLR